MPGKDDPLGQHGSYGGRTLWLRPDNMRQARDNFWKSFLDAVANQRVDRVNMQDTRAGIQFPAFDGSMTVAVTVPIDEAKAQWDIAWAAALAAFSFVMEGRVEPK